MVVTLFVCTVVAGCATTPDPQGGGGSEPVDFDFKMGVGGGLGGMNVLQINKDGTAHYVFCEAKEPEDTWLDPGKGTGQWRRLDFSVSEDMRRKLWAVLRDASFFELNDQYSSGAMDGTQWYVAVRRSGKTKRVWCDNSFPAEIQRIVKFAQEKILEEQRKHRTEATDSQRDRKSGFEE